MGNNTGAVITRFWARMGELYGNRWQETYGVTPTQAWRELVDRFSPNEIATALSDLQSLPHLRQHPPTLPQLEALLIAAQRRGKAEMTGADWRRGFWRAAVMGGVITQANHLIGVNRWEPGNLEALMVAHRDTLGRAMRDLLDELDDLEARTGQRTAGMEAKCLDRTIAIARTYRHLFEVSAIDNREGTRH